MLMSTGSTQLSLSSRRFGTTSAFDERTQRRPGCAVIKTPFQTTD